MAIIPKLSDGGGGLIRGAVSAAGNVAQQVKGVANREAVGLRPQSILGQVGRVVDMQTGGLLTAGRRLLGMNGEVDDTQPGMTASGKPINVSGLPQWGGLSDHLIASIYPCDSKGVEKPEKEDAPVKTIFAPATEIQFESTLNWQSPFENSGPESKAPTMMALLQTGQIGTVANALQHLVPDNMPGAETIRDALGSVESGAKDLEGRTGITKLNSRQVFSGMPPVRLTMILHFRAVTNPETEVMQPYRQLLQWAFPQELAKNGVIEAIIRNESGEGFIKNMFPSRAPQMVGFRYANNLFSPMVIETIGNPLDGPMDKDGRPLYRAVQLTLATLEALEADDVQKYFTSNSRG